MSLEQRRRTILERLDSKGAVLVAELGAQFGVSEMTIRRDLDELERQGLLQRVHGGAVSSRGRSYEPAFLRRSSAHLYEKQRIAAVAIDLIQNGDSIALDVGTTTLEMARLLGSRRDLTIITSSLRIACELAETQGLRLILTGGVLRHGEMSMVGQIAVDALQQFFVDKLFLGIGGIDLEAGLTEYSLEDALVKRAMVRAAKEVIVVSDASKLGRVTFAVVAPVTVANRIITDSRAEPAIIAALRARNIDVLVV